MKKTLLIIILAMISSFTKAQTVNGVAIKDLNVEYVEIQGTAKNLMGTKVLISMDFGQKFDWKDDLIRDENGQKMIFNSMIDALNFMSKNGYTFVDAYAVQGIYIYILKKK